jgi:hypothetical protein
MPEEQADLLAPGPPVMHDPWLRPLKVDATYTARFG